MNIERVSFGGQHPPTMDYKFQETGEAEVWLYDNIHQTEYGDWEADAVFIRTRLSPEEIQANAADYFVPEEPPVTLEDLRDAINILTEIVLEG